MEFLLCALTPPGSINREIGKIRDILYSRWGLASALALPVLIPLLFLPIDIDIPDKKKLKTLAVSGFYCVTRTFAPIGRHLFLGLDCMYRAKELAAFVETLIPRSPGKPDIWRPIPELSGFYLCELENLSGFEEVIASLEPPPKLHFPIHTISFVKAEILSADNTHALPGTGRQVGMEPISTSTRFNWWQALQWEEVTVVRLKKA